MIRCLMVVRLFLNRGGLLAMQMPLFDEAIAHVDFVRGDAGLGSR